MSEPIHVILSERAFSDLFDKTRSSFRRNCRASRVSCQTRKQMPACTAYLSLALEELFNGLAMGFAIELTFCMSYLTEKNEHTKASSIVG